MMNEIKVCQCNGCAKVIDAEEFQEMKKLILESLKAAIESKRQNKISTELIDKAIKLGVKNHISYDEFMVIIRTIRYSLLLESPCLKNTSLHIPSPI